MAVALLGYFSTMVAALAVSLVLLNGVLSSSLVHRTHLQPYPAPAVAEAAVQEPAPSAPQVAHNAADNVADADREPSATQKADRLDVARVQKQQEKRQELALRKQKELARQQALARQQQPDTMALSYNQVAPQPSGPSLFNLFTARRL